MGDRDRRPEVKILGSKSSIFCVRVEWALILKGVAYEYIEEDVRNKSELLLKLNPVHKKIPVLLHGGTVVSESLVILEYIDEVWSEETRPRLLPDDPYERAQARFFAKFLDEKLVFGAWRACVAEGDGKEKAIEAAIESFAVVEKQIEGKKFFGGERVGFLDLVAGWLVFGLGVIEEVGAMKLLDPNRFPLLHDWTQRLIRIPLIKESLPPREIISDYMTAIVSYARSVAASKS